MLKFQKSIHSVGLAGLFCLASSLAQAAPITFSATDYDNSVVQTFGYFRDVHNGAMINRGQDLGGPANGPGSNTALNFTGSDSNASPLGRVTVYDTTPIDGTVKNMFTGNMSMSADILISRFNNGKGGGLVTMFNEGAGNTGIALFLTNAGNSDSFSVKLQQQTGVSTSNLGSVSLNDDILEDTWYRLMLDLAFNGQDFTITGKVFSHALASNPNSALGSQVGTTLTYTDVAPWSTGLSNPYEIGLVARAVSGEVDTSITNFDFQNDAAGTVPEPGTLALLGLGVAGFLVRRRSIGARK